VAACWTASGSGPTWQGWQEASNTRWEMAELSAVGELERGGENGEDMQLRNRLMG